jgi:hypothetical protein
MYHDLAQNNFNKQQYYTTHINNINILMCHKHLIFNKFM